MPIVVTCAGCKKKIRAADKLVDKFVKCPHCAHKVKVTIIPASAVVPAVTTLKSGAKGGAPAAVKTPMTAAKPVVVPAKTTSAKKTPSGNTSPVAATKPIPVKKKPVPVNNAMSAEPMPTPPRSEPKRETPKPKPAPSRRYDDDEEDGNPRRLLLLASGAGILAVVGLVFLYFAIFNQPSLGNVKGKVQFGDQPLNQASIVFISLTNPKQSPVNSNTAPDGDYKMNGHTGKGLPLGKYKVIVSKMVMPDGRIPQGPEGEIAREQGRLQELIPAEYSNVAQTKLDAEVKGGNNTFNFSIPKSP